MNWNELTLPEPRKPVVYERARLYAEVWLEPVNTVAERYGVSGVALAKMCRKLGVPLPGRGYWAKKAAGRASPRAKLPALKKGQPSTIESYRWRTEPAPKPTLTASEAEAIEKEQSPDVRIVVGSALDSPHPLVEKSFTAIAKTKPDDDGMVRHRRATCLNIVASAPVVDRALRIADALIKGMEAREIRVTTRPPKRTREADRPEAVGTWATVAGSPFSFGIYEATRPGAPQPGPPLTELDRLVGRKRKILVPQLPSGRLVLEIFSGGAPGGRRRWADGRVQRLEEILNEFVAEVLTIPAALRAEGERRQAEQDARNAEEKRAEEAERLRREQQRRAEAEAEHLKNLERDVVLWERSCKLREYVAASARAIVENGGRIAPGGSFERWSEWALAHADAIDPIEELRVSIKRSLRDAAENAAKLAAEAGVTLAAESIEPLDP